MQTDSLKIAIVHDDFIQHGGAERLVLAMLEIWPKADLYSVAASEGWKKEIKKLINKDIRTTWVDTLPLKDKLFRYYYSLYPLAVESFKFDGYDLVVSSSARYAHGIITKPGTIHVAYVNSPARFLWQKELAPRNIIADKIIAWHKSWDKVASTRPDYIIANSKTPAARIEKFWNRKSDAIIYPFVDLGRFSLTSIKRLNFSKKFNLPENAYFLVVTRLSKWKKVDVAIEVCNELRLPLVIVGRGEDNNYLRSISGPTIVFLDDVSDEELASTYKDCRALIMTQEEDFGITALETQACGKPVIAYRSGGSLETVVEGVTGVFFDSQSKESLKQALLQFDQDRYIGENCTTQAEKFGKSRFQEELRKFCNNALRNR